MEKRVIALVGAAALSSVAVVVLLQQLKIQRERREFEERYAKQLRAAREAHESSHRGGSVSQLSADASDAEAEAEETATVKVIYGSESGNAEALARGFVMSLRDRGVPATLVDPSRWAYLENYLYHNKANVPLFHPLRAARARSTGNNASHDAAAAAKPLVYIFIVATSGEGEPTGNFMGLYQEMQVAVRKATAPVIPPRAPSSSPAATAAVSPPELPFKDVHYAVFGLGDSSYKYYCRAATDTNTLMKKGGGTNLHRVGFGDARSGHQEDVFEEWEEKVLAALQEKCGFALTTGSLAPPQPEYQLRFHYASTSTANPSAPGDNLKKVSTEAPNVSDTTATIAADAAAIHAKTNIDVRGNDVSTASAGLSASTTTVAVALPPVTAASVQPFPPPPALLEPSLLHPARIKLLSKTQLTLSRESDGSSVFRFCFETDGTNISFQAGDHLGIFPTNSPETVARCAAALSISAGDLETPVELCEPVPSRGILRNVLPACVPLCVVLQRYIDLSGRPKKSALRVLAKYCTDPVEQAEFLEVIRHPTDADGEAQLHEKATQPSSGHHHHHHHHAAAKQLRTVVDYMERFPSCCGIPLGHFIEVMPRIQPRYYSIASDRLSHGTQIEIIVRVLTDGLASGYLGHRVHDGEEVFGYVRISSFHLPQRIGDNRPLLLIGPGTGAAAMVGLCYKKEALMRRQPTLQYGPLMFLFGAQHRSREYFVEEEVMRWCMPPAEMQRWDEEHPDAHSSIAAHRAKVQPPALLPCSVITHHDSAFSRDQEEKVYVTTLIDRYKDRIYEMLTSTDGGGCLVYLSGDASFMAKDVDRALSTLLQEKGGMTRVASLEFLRRMEADHRYLKDVY